MQWLRFLPYHSEEVYCVFGEEKQPLILGATTGTTTTITYVGMCHAELTKLFVSMRRCDFSIIFSRDGMMATEGQEDDE